MSESLANGAKTEFLLSAGDSITITGNCEVTTQYAGTSRLQKNPSTVGPFQVDARVLIAATASVTYTIIDMEPGNQFSTAEETALRALAAVEAPLVSLAAVEDSVVSLVSGGGIRAFDAPVVEAADKTFVAGDSYTPRAPSTSVTYTVDVSTAWEVGDSVLVFLPTSGTISFAVSGGATLNGATATLTRTLAGNAIGMVSLSRIQGANAYSLSGA